MWRRGLSWLSVFPISRGPPERRPKVLANFTISLPVSSSFQCPYSHLRFAVFREFLMISFSSPISLKIYGELTSHPGVASPFCFIFLIGPFSIPAVTHHFLPFSTCVFFLLFMPSDFLQDYNLYEIQIKVKNKKKKSFHLQRAPPPIPSVFCEILKVLKSQ